MKDSIKDIKSVNPEGHVFSNHLLIPTQKKKIEIRNQPFETWPAYVLFISVVIIVFLRSGSYKKSAQIMKAFFSFKATKQLEREEYRLNKATSIVLSFLFLSSFSLFLVNVEDHFDILNWQQPNHILFFVFFGALVLIYFIKFIFLGFLAWLTRSEAQFSEYLFNIFMTNKAIGFFLVPLLILLEYVYPNEVRSIYLGLIVCLFFYFSRLIRGVRIYLSGSYFSEFHLFLYLCVLEILPLVVLIKLLVSKF